MTNPLQQLKNYGQSVWYDNIDRAQLASGQFQRMLNEDGIVGVTANPTIFEKSISAGHAYDEQMSELIKAGKSTNEIYEALVIKDIQTVADLLRPVYDKTEGQDGYVSLEVSPELANDTSGTISEAKRFWGMVNRPNLMIKIPATPAGIPAIYETLRAGINVNITLIFSIESYRDVVDAYLRALEDRNGAGEDISSIASVASFFVSRVDTLVDKLLEEKIKATSDSAEQQKLKSLEGKAAIANARVVYQDFKRLFSTPRFESLKHAGAHVQRPLWASTSTKNPAYRDVLYAEELIGPDTVDTMPLETIEKFRDHGKVSNTVENDTEGAKTALAELEKVGIHYAQVTKQLQDEGVQKFADSFHQLFEGIESKKQSIQAGQAAR
ncbi:transaldolase [Ktedonosporobacter rubrisoli]|uniref:Transaldolase n=1 Tax=Ktedonosporobacter rubrisoli TaxID=2509675 RepID=A0A4P6K1M2_KTERU|nr:transaldolase [Ktedonosporobacter rubrisoli]QBD81989.1 transaldolase [Ktedonosporobacter rubrisoli]